MEHQIFTDLLVKPEANELKSALGKKFSLYDEFTGKIAEKNLVPEWHYYNDGKSWLCKILNKKKNLCWLSVWNTGFKLTFYFTEKTIAGVMELKISECLKEAACKSKHTGKLIPILLLVKNKAVMNDGLKLLEYKMTLK